MAMNYSGLREFKNFSVLLGVLKQVIIIVVAIKAMALIIFVKISSIL
jgi:hypothetical protein